MSLTLTVNGQQYRRWTSVRVTRGLKRAVSDFELELPGELAPALLPFAPCTLKDGADLLLTGDIVAVSPDVRARETVTQIAGQSKTRDLVDCMPAFDTNQFNGSALDAIARAVCKPFGIGVVVGTGVSVGDAFPDATFERAVTGFAFLERLARQRAVLLTDDEHGSLVLATAGTARAPGSLRMGEGGTVARAKGTLNGKGRFSSYTIRSQAGLKLTGSDVQTGIEAVAYDGGVPRYRPWAGLAETAAMPGDAQKRAQWEAAHRSGQAVKAVLTVPEWRVDGALWRPNQLVACDVPRLALKGDFLIGAVTFREDREGRRTDLEIAPRSAYMPEPPAAPSGAGAWTGIIKVAS